MKDYYSILRVRTSASTAEIKRAYRMLAVKYHPDKNPSFEAQELIKEINEAYDVLGDNEKKIVYDQRLSHLLQEPVKEEHVRAQRDPRYRPRHTQNVRRKKSQQVILMEEFHSYSRLINVVGLFVIAVAILDFIIPYHTTEETITDIYSRKSARQYFLNTASGKSIEVDENPAAIGTEITYSVGRIFGMAMKVNSRTHSYEIIISTFYREFVAFPLLLLFTSFVGFWNRRNAVMAFNYCVGTVIMLLLNFALLTGLRIKG